jgi:hypothetical protein
MDRNKLVALLMVVVLGVVAWGYVDGWFSPAPENRGIQVSTADAATPGVRVRTRPGDKPATAERETPAGKSLVPPGAPYQPQGTLRLGTPPEGETVLDDSEATEPEPEEDDPPRPAPRRWFGDPPPLGTPRAPAESAPLFAVDARDGRAGGRNAAPQRSLAYNGGPHNHWVDEVGARGSTLELEDGSVWEVYDAHQSQAARWDAADTVTVTPGAQLGYPYRISLSSGRGSVSARLIKPPNRKGLKAGEELMTLE